MLNNLEIEIKQWDKSYSFSSEANGKKRIYVIYSPELKQKLRAIISPYGLVNERLNMSYEGKNSQGDRIIYQQGKNNDLPDQLTLISRELAIQYDNKELEKRKREEEEKKRVRGKWREAETKFKIPSGSTRHYWCCKDEKGNVIEDSEGMYFNSETNACLILPQGIKNITNSRIQEITDEESKKDDSTQQKKHLIAYAIQTTAGNKKNAIGVVASVAGLTALMIGYAIFLKRHLNIKR